MEKFARRAEATGEREYVKNPGRRSDRDDQSRIEKVGREKDDCRRANGTGRFQIVEPCNSRFQSVFHNLPVF